MKSIPIPPKTTRQRSRSTTGSTSMDGSASSSRGANASLRRSTGSHHRNSSLDSSLNSFLGSESSNHGVGISFYARSGRVFSEQERETRAKRRGICVNCGIPTHSKTALLISNPLTNDHVYQGICIQCYPEQIPKEYILEVRVNSVLKAVGNTVTCTAPETMSRKIAPTKYPQFGGGPSGKIILERLENLACPGFKNASVMELFYQIPSGVQLNYHPNEGSNYDGKRIRAYLPNNRQGRELLIRIMVAFVHGYMVKIGKSVTTGKENQTIFTDIPNKTSLEGGQFGFPDPTYMDVCHAKLDLAGIPNVATCLAFLEAPPYPNQDTDAGEPEISIPRLMDFNSDQSSVDEQNAQRQAEAVTSVETANINPNRPKMIPPPSGTRRANVTNQERITASTANEEMSSEHFDVMKVVRERARAAKEEIPSEQFNVMKVARERAREATAGEKSNRAAPTANTTSSIRDSQTARPGRTQAQTNDPEIAIMATSWDDPNETKVAQVIQGGGENSRAPFAQAQLVVEGKSRKQQQSTQKSATILARIQALEEQVGIQLGAGTPSITERLDQVEMLLFGKVETTEKLTKDRLSYLEDHIF